MNKKLILKVFLTITMPIWIVPALLAISFYVLAKTVWLLVDDLVDYLEEAREGNKK